MRLYTVYLLLQTALNVPDGDTTHHQEHIYLYLQLVVRPVPDAVNTVICDPDDGCCHQPKHAEQFAAINKLYIVARRWTIINTDLRCTDL